jgi:hypothetical protein
VKLDCAILMISILTASGVFSEVAISQSLAVPRGVSSDAVTEDAGQPTSNYTRPTHGTMVRNYLFDAYGPYPIIGAAVAAGINQANNAPPDWNQGLKGYGRRFGSNFGIAVVSTTTRYGLSQAFRQDSMYYRCECRGVLPRLGHAMISTLTARRGVDGHRVFSLPALVAPYVGATTAVYGWYPGRFGAKDALRLGSYNMLFYMSGNVSLEFLYSGPHSMLSRMHMNNLHGAPAPGPNH